MGAERERRRTVLSGSAPQLAVRPMTLADIDLVVRYWSTASHDDLARMGVDPKKLPTPDVLDAQLRQLVATPKPDARTFYSVWLIDGRPIGYSALKNIRRGDRADMHLHMWDAPSRGKGYGATLFCRCALDFFERFRVREIVCEPSVQNPMPNAMLQRVGFPLLRTRVGVSSELSAVGELNVYRIDRAVAERFLRAPPAPA